MTTKKKVQHAVDVWHMEYRDGTSNKFYRVFVAENGLTVLQWGRIGSSGQSSIARYGTYDEARDHGLKQVFAKKAKGYVQKFSDLRFLVDEEVLDQAQRDYLPPLNEAWVDARENGDVNSAKQTVLKHYEDFSDRVQKLLNRSATESFEDLSGEYESIEQVWAEISDKHAEVTAALNLTKAALFQKMMGV